MTPRNQSKVAGPAREYVQAAVRLGYLESAAAAEIEMQLERVGEKQVSVILALSKFLSDDQISDVCHEVRQVGASTRPVPLHPFNDVQPADVDPSLAPTLPPESMPQVAREEAGPLTGMTIKGYEIGKLIKSGGQGSVYKAHHLALNRDAAVKVLHEEQAQSIRRFKREAQAMARSEHPNIVQIFDWVEDRTKGGRPGGHTSHFIIMQYLEGGSLASRLASGKRLPVKEALRITLTVVRALAFAHRQGIVHRDVKPENILFSGSGDVKISDFGISKSVREGSTRRLTYTGMILGTLQYLSPEQARGEDVDERSDIYSLGVVLYRMITGHPPYSGDAPTILRRITSKDFEPKPVRRFAAETPYWVSDLVEGMMRKDREGRIQSCDEVIRRIRAGFKKTILRGRPDRWITVDKDHTLRFLKRGVRWAIRGSLLLVLLSASIVSFAWYKNQRRVDLLQRGWERLSVLPLDAGANQALALLGGAEASLEVAFADPVWQEVLDPSGATRLQDLEQRLARRRGQLRKLAGVFDDGWGDPGPWKEALGDRLRGLEEDAEFFGRLIDRAREPYAALERATTLEEGLRALAGFLDRQVEGSDKRERSLDEAIVTAAYGNYLRDLEDFLSEPDAGSATHLAVKRWDRFSEIGLILSPRKENPGEWPRRPGLDQQERAGALLGKAVDLLAKSQADVRGRAGSSVPGLDTFDRLSDECSQIGQRLLMLERAPVDAAFQNAHDAVDRARRLRSEAVGLVGGLAMRAFLATRERVALCQSLDRIASHEKFASATEDLAELLDILREVLRAQDAVVNSFRRGSMPTSVEELDTLRATYYERFLPATRKIELRLALDRDGEGLQRLKKLKVETDTAVDAAMERLEKTPRTRLMMGYTTLFKIARSFGRPISSGPGATIDPLHRALVAYLGLGPDLESTRSLEPWKEMTRWLAKEFEERVQRMEPPDSTTSKRDTLRRLRIVRDGLDEAVGTEHPLGGELKVLSEQVERLEVRIASR